MGGAGTAPREQKELRKTKRGRLGWKQGQGELLGHAGTGLGVRAPEGPSRPEEKDGDSGHLPSAFRYVCAP